LTLRVSLVRHGKVYNPRDIFYGCLPGFGLSAEGREQAKAVSAFFRNKDLVAIYSSPLLRARQTAEIISAPHTGLQKHISHLLTEAKTPFEGRSIGEAKACNWDLYTGSGKDYEQLDDILARMGRFMLLVRRRYLDGHVLAVTHGDCIATFSLWVHGRIMSPENRLQNYPKPCSISTFTFETLLADEIPKWEYLKPW
jgi:broad specificity phosphatase PhoE